MAYGRPQGNSGGGGRSQYGNSQGRGQNNGGQYNGGRGGSGGGPNRGGATKGAKPDYRLAEMTEQDGKKVTVKDPTTGKTVYIGAMWSNPYGGFNVEIELDGQKIRARAFPTADDGQFAQADRRAQQDQQPPQGGGRGGRQQRGDDQDDED